MSGLWIDEVILDMKRKPADMFLLALICYRAAGMNGQCRDTDKELAKISGIHYQTVSDMVAKFKREGLLSVVTNRTETNPRAILPISKILIPYQENADRWSKRNADRGISKTLRGYKESTDTPISNPLIPYQQNTDTIYKDEKTLEKEEEKSENHAPANAVTDDLILDVEAEEVFDDEPTGNSLPPNPGCAAPLSPTAEEQAELDEISHYTSQLASNSRVIEGLSRLCKVRGDVALEWINRFVTKQWSGNNLTGRTFKDLSLHCTSWIEQELKKEKQHEERKLARGSNRNINRQSQAEVGVDLDRLAEEFFGA